MNGQVFNTLQLTSPNLKEFFSPFFSEPALPTFLPGFMGNYFEQNKIVLSPLLGKKTPQWLSSPWAISWSFSLTSHHMDTEFYLISAISTQMESCIGGPEIAEMFGLEF